MEAERGVAAGVSENGVSQLPPQSRPKGSLPSVSVVTVSFHSLTTIADTLDSVAAQRGVDVEHIVVDGGSTDGTLELLESRRADLAHLVSEPDQGIYDAMNKGIRLASGDVVAILNSDDVYASDTTLASVAARFAAEPDAAVVMGHVVFVRSIEGREPIRVYRSRRFRPWMMRFGWMPPHPATFVRRAAYLEHGEYRTDYRIGSDYEMLVRLLVVARLTFAKLDEVCVLMRPGGVSTAGVAASVTLNREIVRACRENGLATNLALVLSKTPFKLVERLRRG